MRRRKRFRLLGICSKKVFRQRKRCQVLRSWETSVTRRRNNAPDTSRSRPGSTYVKKRRIRSAPPSKGHTLGRDQPKEGVNVARFRVFPSPGSPFHEPPKTKAPPALEPFPAPPYGGRPPPARFGKSRTPPTRDPDRCRSEPPAFGLRAAAGKTGKRPSTPPNRLTTHQGEQPVREKSVSRSSRPLPAPGRSTAETRMKMVRTPSLGFPKTDASF